FVKSPTPNQATFPTSKRTSWWSKIRQKVRDIDGAISASGLQPASFANFPVGHNAKFVKSPTPNQATFPTSKRTSRWSKIRQKISDIDGAISTSGLQPASF